MNTDNWPKNAAALIYESYPGADLLPIEPPPLRPTEPIESFAGRVANKGDSLFEFICCEACDTEDREAFCTRLQTAISDLQAVLSHVSLVA